MAKYPTFDEMAKNLAEKALDDFLYDGKSIREWMKIIVSEDCISREEVCDYIAEFVNHEYATDRECEMVELIISGIQHLPSIQPKPKTGWIPVSERLPEKSGLYLVTNRANEIEVFSFTGHDMARVFWSKYAKAWMPLPEPYEAESEDEKWT